MAKRLRFGILGLGRRWPRYRRALLAMADEMRVVAVHDPSAMRSEQEARSLGAKAVGGVVELLERPEVDAVLLTGGAWYGLWPLEQAVRVGKRALCCVSPIEDEANLDTVRAKLTETSGIDFALWPVLTVLRETLVDRLEESLGPPLFVQMTWSRRRELSHSSDLPTSPAALAMLRECADLFGATPVQVAAHGTTDLMSLMLHFPKQRSAQLTLWAGPSARTSCRLYVEAENGTARAELPRQLEWEDGDGRHHHELPAGMAEMVTLDGFARAVRAGESTCCTFPQVDEALGWLRQARQALRSNSPAPAIGDGAKDVRANQSGEIVSP